MLIVSQDKTELINFSNIVRLGVSNNTQGQVLIEVHNFYDDFETVIGLYRTEERASEVLKEIAQCYANTEQYKCICNTANAEFLNDLLENAFIYAMPEK